MPDGTAWQRIAQVTYAQGIPTTPHIAEEGGKKTQDPCQSDLGENSFLTPNLAKREVK